MKIDYIISILLRVVLVLLAILFIAILAVDIELSIEFIILIGIVFVLPITLIIIKLMSDMRKKEKANQSLDKSSDEYIKNRKKILSKSKIIVSLVIILEILFCIFNQMLTCMCGHHEFKVLPMSIYVIMQIIYYLYYFRKLRDKEYTVQFLNNFIISSFILFLIIVILSKNDMDKLHRP